MHGAPPERHGVKQTRSAVLWGLCFPLLSIVLVWWTFGLSVLVYLLMVCAQMWRIRSGQLKIGRSKAHAGMLGRDFMIAKFAQANGVLLFWYRKLMKKQATLIEYKGSPDSGAKGADG